MKLSVGIPDYDCYQIGIAASEKARNIRQVAGKKGRIACDFILLHKAVVLLVYYSNLPNAWCVVTKRLRLITDSAMLQNDGSNFGDLVVLCLVELRQAYLFFLN